MEATSSAAPSEASRTTCEDVQSPSMAPGSSAASCAASSPGDLDPTVMGTNTHGHAEASDAESTGASDPVCLEQGLLNTTAMGGSKATGATQVGDAAGESRSRPDCAHEIHECTSAGKGPESGHDSAGPGIERASSLPGTVSAESTPHPAPLPTAASEASSLSIGANAASRPARRSRDMARVSPLPITVNTLRQPSAKNDTLKMRLDELTPLPPSVTTSSSSSGPLHEDPGTESVASTSGETASKTPRHRQRAAPLEAGRRTSLAGYYSRAAARRPLRVVRALVKKATSMLRVLTGGRKEGASIQDFRLHKVVGQGAFGVVHLCTRRRRPNKLYALKSMDKKDLLARNETEQALAEKEALLALSGHPFIVKTYKTFQDQMRLYFVMEFVAGGDLFDQLERRRRLTEDETRFYGAEIAVALEYMHSKNFLYRDLKIENVMLDASGHVKLTDLGFSRRSLPGERRHTFVGTPDYLAPEIVNGKGHGRAVDFWAFGVLLFELIAGVPPFFGDSQKELYKRIVEGDFRFPPPKSAADPPFTKMARDLIQGLLEVDPGRRLGSGPRGWGDVKAHPWFAGVAWDAVAKRGLQPPLVPPVYHHRKPAKYIDPLEVYRWHASPSGGLVLAGAAGGARVHPDPISRAGPSSPQSTSNVFGAF
ncbi:serine/threonine protein kinase [Klebsormidium nitens]|uniref:Serine/threonine protein kinase n=1 Tax=Klebsormidium nitens TaxID=105231 RepID=A0A1Y1IJR3_KLENI|nr:serine/threonine protein kinase [Klebsormidium nitens]|eukprot:GAQ89371.1 serine/threonine protein kinase [Klebsormidium nitens]